MLRDLRTGFGFLSRRRRWQWAGLVPLSVLAALAESAGAAGVFLLIAVLSKESGTPGGTDLDAVPEWLQGALLVAPSILFLTALLALFYLLKNAFLGFFLYLQNLLFRRTGADLARSLLESYLRAPYGFHLRRSTAELVHRVSEGCHRVVSLVLGSAVAGLTEVLVVLGILAVLVAASPLVTLLTVTSLGVLLAAVLRWQQGRFQSLGERDIRLRKEVLSSVQQTLAGIKEIRVFARDAFYRRRFAHQQNALARTVAQLRFLEQVPRLVIETLFVGATLLVVMLVAGPGQTATDVLPLLGLYAYAGFRIIPSFNRLILYANLIAQGASSVRDLEEDLARLDVADSRGPSPGARAQESDKAPSVVLAFHDEIRLEGVSYAYDRGTVVEDVSFSLSRGGSLGLVGATGAGKSTLVDIVLGLLEPTRGRVLVDGVDIRTDLEGWRRKIGYVPQSIFLLDDTLERNIAFALETEEIERERVHRAVRLASLEPLVAELPDGLGTRLGEDGVGLSGGQRQRVAIARALYHDPELLIFDEATSALDSGSEKEVNEAIRSLGTQKTTLVVAHRPSTLRGCRQLVFLRGGRVEARGTFDELSRDHPAFLATVAGAANGADD